MAGVLCDANALNLLYLQPSEQESVRVRGPVTLLCVVSPLPCVERSGVVP